jgi:hypothetical protein
MQLKPMGAIRASLTSQSRRSRALVILTLNLRHFDPLGVATFNPLYAA